MEELKKVRRAYGNKVLNRKRWYQIVEDYKKSDKTQKDYCNERQISASSLQYWMSQFKQEGLQFIPIKSEAPGEIKENKVHRYCTLQLGKGRQLIIESREALQELKSILLEML